MNKTIKFLGGPADQELRTVPQEAMSAVWMEAPAVLKHDLEDLEPDSIVPIVYHNYFEAFPGASFFRYQGSSEGTTGEVAATHRRRYVLLDLNMEYIELQKKRTTTDVRLF